MEWNTVLNIMLWYECLFAGLTLFGIFCYNLIEKKVDAFRNVSTLVWLLACVYVFYIPYFFLKENFFSALFNGFVNIMQVVSLDADYTACYAALDEHMLTFFAGIYKAAVSLLHFVVPCFTMLTAFNLLLRFFSTAHLSFIVRRKRPLYVFSTYNVNTLQLAKSIREEAEKKNKSRQKNNTKCDLIFADVNDNVEKTDINELSDCAYHPNKVCDLLIEQNEKREVYYFCCSDDDERNLNDTLALIEKTKNIARDKKLSTEQGRAIEKNTHIFFFTHLEEPHTLIDSVDKGMINLSVINPTEEIVYNFLSKYPLFKYVRKENNKKKISVLLVGFNELNRTFLRAASWCGQLPGFELEITIADIELNKKTDSFFLKYPGLRNETTKQLFVDENGGSSFHIHMIEAMCDQELYTRISEKALTSTYIVVDMGTDTTNIESALYLRRTVYREQLHQGHLSVKLNRRNEIIPEPAIFAYITNNEKYVMVENLGTGGIPYGIIPFGCFRDVYSFYNLIDSPVRFLSKNIHLVYQSIDYETKEFMQPVTFAFSGLIQRIKKCENESAAAIDLEKVKQLQSLLESEKNADFTEGICMPDEEVEKLVSTLVKCGVIREIEPSSDSGASYCELVKDSVLKMAVDEAMHSYNRFEVDRRSNIANAMHIRYKLATIGLDFVSEEDSSDDSDEMYEVVDEDTLRKLIDENLEVLSKAEHDRWMAFEISEGWIPVTTDEVKEYWKNKLGKAGNPKSPYLKMHPYICLYDELPERSATMGKTDAKVYDEQLVRHIPDILRDVWGISGKRYKVIRYTENTVN